MTHYEVLDKYERVEFDGDLLAEVSTETPDDDRWIEIEIYRLTDPERDDAPTGRYLIHRVGRSVRYHRHDGPCNTGVLTMVRHLDADALPCPVCAPPPLPELLATAPGAHVDRELDKDTVDLCDARDVYQRLLLKRRDPRTGEVRTFLSNPARRAWEEAAARDPLLSAVTRVARRVS